MPENSLIAETILKKKDQLAIEIITHQFQADSQEWAENLPDSYQKSIRDVGYHLEYLSEAIETGQEMLFNDYIAWVKILFTNLNFPDSVLPQTLDSMRVVLNDNLDETSSPVVNKFLEAGIAYGLVAPETTESHLHPSSPLFELAQAYLEALLSGNRRAASKMILDAVKDGIPVKTIYLEVFEKTQKEIGRLWQINKISVAQEHYCTAATQMIMSQLYPHIFSAEPKSRVLLATGIGGELHEVGIRMVADFFEMEGWDTYFMGANLPENEILFAVKEKKPDILAISATITSNVSDVAKLISRIKQEKLDQLPRIIVGGYPFNIAPDLWSQVGADGTAKNAQEALQLAEQLIAIN